VHGGGQHVNHVRAVGGRDNRVEVLAERADHPGRFRALEHQLQLVFCNGESGSGRIRGHRAFVRVGQGILHLTVLDEYFIAIRHVILHLFQPLVGFVLKSDFFGFLQLVAVFFLDLHFLFLFL